jgi:hypothetical protein
MEMRTRATGPQLAAVGILSVLALAAGILLALLGTDPETRSRAIDVALVAWFGLTVPSVAYVVWDAFTNTPLRAELLHKGRGCSCRRRTRRQDILGGVSKGGSSDG